MGGSILNGPRFRRRGRGDVPRASSGGRTMTRLARTWVAALVLTGAMAVVGSSATEARQTAPSDKPDNPFKLATFEAGGTIRLGLVLGSRVLDIAGANQHLVSSAGVPPDDPAWRDEGAHRAVRRRSPSPLPDRELLQVQHHRRPAIRVRCRQGVVQGAHQVSVEPAGRHDQLQAARRRHGRSHHRRSGCWLDPAPPPPTGYDASAAARIVPDRDAPVIFAKSPRSCIIDPDEPSISSMAVSARTTRASWRS